MSRACAAPSRATFAGLLLLSAGCSRDPDVPYALVIVLDGVRTDEFSTTLASPLTGVSGEEWAARTWERLAPDAVAARAALNPGVTLTAPAHAVLVTGRPTTYANYGGADTSPGAYLPEVPTLFEAARAQLDLVAGEVLLVANTGLLHDLARSSSPAGGLGADVVLVEGRDAGVAADDDAPVFDALRQAIDDGPPRLIVANVHDSDRAGHAGPVDDYPNTVARADALLADFLQWLDRAHPVYARNALIVVTADHGRHDGGDEADWRNHGDACRGCREVPLFVRGGGAHAGEILEGPWSTQDLAPTVAAHLGVELPFADGLPLSPLIEGLDEGGRSGEQVRGAAGTVVATRVLGDTFEARARAVFDGETLSSDSAFDVDGLAVGSSDAGDLACFRELLLDPAAASWPWIPRCFLRSPGGIWDDVGFPMEADGGPVWTAAITPSADGFGVAWVANAAGAAQQPANETSGEAAPLAAVGFALATFTPGRGWTNPTLVSANFPTDPTLARTEGGWIAAVGTNPAGSPSAADRLHRIVRVADGDGATLAELDAVDVLGEDARAERPALRWADGVLSLAFLGIGRDGRAVLVSRSADGGHTWDAPEALDGADPFVHVSPAWNGPDLVWAGLDHGEAVVCRASSGTGPTACEEVGSARIDGLAVGAEGVLVTRDVGVGRWEPKTLGR